MVYVYAFMRITSTTPLKSFSAPMGSWTGIARRPKTSCTLASARSKRRTFAVELVDDDRARQIELVGEAPDLFGLHFDAGHAIHQHQRGIGGDQRRLGVVDENIEAGRVDEIDLFLGPLGERDAGGNGDLALDLLVVEIGDRRTFIDARQPIGGACGVQKPGGEGRLPTMAVSYKSDVSDV